MNKDVIYIDVEDDITAIISKVKASKEKIVALVPPKRIGVLQSAVNLRLLARAAEQGSKRLVLITNNHALMSLAASASLPVAKNLQSKPEMAEITALEVDDGDDVIDGNDLPIGDHAGLKDDETDASEAVAGLATPPKANEPLKKPKAKSGVRVPNFNTFRRKMILGIGLGVALIVFLIWAIFIAPHATVVVSAKTSDSSVNNGVTIGDTLKTDLAKNTIKAVVVKETEEKSVDFTATGKKNVGEKATGTVNLSHQSPDQTTVPAGTRLSTGGGLIFVTDEAAVIPASTFGPPSCFPTACPGTTSVSVTAEEGGAKYNAASGSLNGAPSGISASFDGSSSGGTDKIAKVATAADVQKAKEQLVEQESDSMRSQLKAGFKQEVKIIDDSYTVDYTNVKSAPEVGAEAASGTGALTATVTYRLYALETAELDSFLNQFLKKSLEGKDDQRVYDNGRKDARFQDVEKTKTGAKLTLIATAKLGPKLDEKAIKEQSRGKKFGEIQEAIQAIEGVEDVDVKFFPFWVGSVPDDVKKISVQFTVNESN